MNPLAIALATVAAFTIGMIWFNGKTFYPIWYRALKQELPTRPETMTAEDKREAAAMFAGTLLAQVGQAVALAWVLWMAHAAYGTMNAGLGAAIGLAVGVGIAALSSLPHRLFSQQGWLVWVIECGGDIAALVAMGAIIGAFG